MMMSGMGNGSQQLYYHILQTIGVGFGSLLMALGTKSLMIHLAC